MAGNPRRIRIAPVTGVLVMLVGCAGGDAGSSFTGTPALTFGSQDAGDDVGDGSEGTGGSDDGGSGGVMTGGADSGGSDDGSGDGPPPPPPGCMPVAEVCNGMDDDCDGAVDNGDPGGGDGCDTMMPGECAAGVTACEGGAIVCNPVAGAVAELCNGLDDDCDGTVDNGDPEGGGACNTGMPGVCSAGTSQCVSGALACEPDTVASAEVCNGLDDDCDSTVDNGNPGGGGACDTGLFGVCAAGTNQCIGGAIMCQQNVPAAASETCGNGLDDDCNGAVDDGCGCTFGLCETPGIPMIDGCDPCVTSVCAADPYCCNTQWDSICVGEVETVCGQADCVSASCDHLVCVTGTALTSGCHQCVTDICAADPFCCNNNWDGLCVNQVATVCGLTCP